MQVVHVKTAADLTACLAIRRAVFMDEQGVSEAEEIDEHDVVEAGCHLYICADDGIPAATARYLRYDEQTAKIQRVAVLQPYRKLGYGRSVMQAIEQMVYAGGFRQAVLDAQCHAEGFYQKLGYTTVSETPFYDAGILHVRMQKTLSPAPAGV